MNLKDKLDHHYKYFDRSQISPDPLEFLHLYKNPLDIEIAGLLSSVFAYGNVKQINSTLKRIHQIMNHHPHVFVINYSPVHGRKIFANLKHRFYSSEDIVTLFTMLNNVYTNHLSLKNIFFNEFKKNNGDLKNSISTFSNKLNNILIGKNDLSIGLRFMFPDPQKGSACKRMNLFLRWMVRKDDLDFGLWNEIPTSKLVIPVDTHVAQICKKLKLTKRKNVSWAMAEEITENLKKFDPIDPVKYDFAICHLGMRNMKF